ncbi:MAG: hypothetical protein PF689_13045 [Deltaproteobacteria bacterium]|jgi:alpha-tubulin suppressor-like RCC1 family protein|nr:hypothetical protein [Deltaproteobacteria bacterium]
MKSFLFISMVFVFFSCGGSDDQNANQVLVNMEPATAEACPDGGIEIFSGVDLDGNGTLDTEEITDSQVVCNGVGEDGQDGEDGKDTLFLAENEPEGSNCTYGGKALHYGRDINDNGLLDSDEIEGTTYVCNGDPGEGFNSLISIMEEEPGTNCTYGGQALRTGLDANNDGLLQPGEVDSTVYVCNGANGYSSLVRQEDEPAGPNCTYGGKAIHSGLDLDTNDYLDPGEVQSSSFVCNGADGADGYNNLSNTQEMESGTECPNGGQLLSTGLDINSNNTLDASEIMNQSYICNGENGGMEEVQVSNAIWGGVCQAGGLKVETGVDVDNNGTLDASEITETQYVCNRVVEVAQTAIGASSSCMLLTTGKIYCKGAITENTVVDENGPLATIAGIDNAVTLNLGSGFGCFTKPDGTLWCWNRNNYGQLGDGTTTDKFTPVQVIGLSSVASTTAEGNHTCAVKTDGTAWCWGRNENGQLGDGTTTNKLTPVQVSGLGSVVSISAGVFHTCALKTDGTVWCWGQNTYGQLGDGTTTDKLTPVQVNDLSSVNSIGAGFYHTCAVKTDGISWCWGRNNSGQLGDGTTTDKNTPVQVIGLSSVDSISGGVLHTCAVKADNTLWCWGHNSNGELGDGTNSEKHTPIQVEGLSSVDSISSNGYHNCAVKTDGTVWCWGYNYSGQLGDGTTENKSLPVKFLIDMQELFL